MNSYNQIRKLGSQVDSCIYHIKNYDQPETTWRVALRHTRAVDGSKATIEVAAEHTDLLCAIDLAWNKFNDALGALRPIRLTPAIEHKKETVVDDEILF